MITKFKIYEGAFYSEDLIRAIYEFLRKGLDDYVKYKGNGLTLTFIQINPDIFFFNDSIFIDKNKNTISIVFRNYYDNHVYLNDIRDCIIKKLSYTDIKYRIIDNYKGYRNTSSINFSISKYNDMIEFFNNLSIDDSAFDIDMIKTKIMAVKYNI